MSKSYQMNKTVLEEIDSVRFRQKVPRRCPDQSGWAHVDTAELKTPHLLSKARYHFKNLLACLLELRKRDIDVCKELTNRYSLIGYEDCIISLKNENKMRVYIKIDRKGDGHGKK